MSGRDVVSMAFRILKTAYFYSSTLRCVPNLSMMVKNWMLYIMSLKFRKAIDHRGSHKPQVSYIPLVPD